MRNSRSGRSWTSARTGPSYIISGRDCGRCDKGASARTRLSACTDGSCESGHPGEKRQRASGSKLVSAVGAQQGIEWDPTPARGAEPDLQGSPPDVANGDEKN